MQKKIYLHVPEPCHENWDIMSPVEQGRFCNSCCKQVTDFSKMTDAEIIEVLSKASGKTCGRFSPHQLERPVIKEIHPVIKPYRLFLSAFIPAFLLANNGISQIMGKIKISDAQSCHSMVKGDTVVVANKELTGKVTDGEGPLGGATVALKGTNLIVTAREDGSFSFRQVPAVDRIVLQVSHVGYSSKEIIVTSFNKPLLVSLEQNMTMKMGEIAVLPHINKTSALRLKVINGKGEALPYSTIEVDNIGETFVTGKDGYSEIVLLHTGKQANVRVTHVGYKAATKSINLNKGLRQDVEITLDANNALPDVTVVAYPTKTLEGISGGLSYVTKVATRDTVRTFIAKTFKNEMFRVYPNPVQKGADIKLSFRHPGNYAVQVFNNAGNLFLSKDFIVNRSQEIISLPLKWDLAPGSYYIKAINDNRKQFIDKLVVQ